MSGRKEVSAKSKRKARSKRRRNETRAEILETARDVVLREGLSNFSLGAVADELGLTKPALYYYFNSKESLIFELVLCEFLGVAAAVEAAVEETSSGADAVEALMRTVFDRYRNRIDMYMLAYKSVPGGELKDLFDPERIERIRPTNDMLYSGAEARLRADQRTGQFPKKRNPRLFAFTAHMAVVGILNMKALTEPAGDPLVHSDDSLIDDICQTFRDAATKG